MKKRERGPVGVANHRLRVGGRSGRCSVVRNQNCDETFESKAPRAEPQWPRSDPLLRNRKVQLSLLEEEISRKASKKINE